MAPHAAGDTAVAAPGFTSIPAASPRFQETYLATGVRLRYAEQGPVAGPPLILLHGYSDSWYSYSRVMGALARSYRVFALDLRGHGDSDRPAAGYAMRDMAADVLALMEAKRLGPATVVGHSMGSFVAQQAAVLAPGRVARLVLIGSGTTPRRIQGVSDLAEAVDSLRDPVPEEFARGFQLSTIYHPIPDDFLDAAVAVSLTLSARTWQDVLAGMLATGPEARLGEIGIPTLILWGDRDAVFDGSEQDALLSAVPGAVLKVYPETGHALHWERPAEFATDLELLLNQ